MPVVKHKDLLNNLSRISLKEIQGTYYRLVSSKRANDLLSPGGSLQYGGRYNAAGEFGALYLGDTKEVCLAERNKRIDSFFASAQTLGKIRITCSRVLDLTDLSVLKKLKIRKDNLLVEQNKNGWDFPQGIARLAHHLDIQALLAPSTTGQGNILIIFDKFIQTTTRLISKHEVVASD